MARTKPGGIAAKLPGAGRARGGLANNLPSPRAAAQEAVRAFAEGFEARAGNRLIINPDFISPALPGTTSPLRRAADQGMLHPSIELMLADPESGAANIAAMARIPGFGWVSSMRPRDAAPLIRDQIEGNLLALRERTPESILNPSGDFYHIGAHNEAQRLASKFDVEPRTAAATLAQLSPRVDWDLNRERADRLLQLYMEHGRTPVGRDIYDYAVSVLGPDHKYTRRVRDIAGSGKSIDDLVEAGDNTSAGVIAYLMDKMRGAEPYLRRGPRGESLGIEGSKYSPPTAAAASAGVAAIRDPSAENLQALIGADAHKIRNFYNNIIAPWDDLLGVTIDTHAVSAGLLTPYSGTQLPVLQAFGNTSMKGPDGELIPTGIVEAGARTGSRGTYGLFADAYRGLARRLGSDVLPLVAQAQSWVPWRYINSADQGRIIDIWRRFDRGEMSISEARQEVLNLMVGQGQMIVTPGSGRPRQGR